MCLKEMRFGLWWLVRWPEMSKWAVNPKNKQDSDINSGVDVLSRRSHCSATIMATVNRMFCSRSKSLLEVVPQGDLEQEHLQSSQCCSYLSACDSHMEGSQGICSQVVSVAQVPSSLNFLSSKPLLNLHFSSSTNVWCWISSVAEFSQKQCEPCKVQCSETKYIKTFKACKSEFYLKHMWTHQIRLSQ